MGYLFPYGMTPAIQLNRLDFLELFLDCGVSLRVIPLLFQTGILDNRMTSAIQFNRVDFVELLINHGVSLRELFPFYFRLVALTM